MIKVRICRLIFSIACASSLCAADQAKAVPKELIQYIRDAAKLGLKGADIEQNAISAGWPEALVKSAIASMQAPAAPDSQPTSNAPAVPQPANTTRSPGQQLTAPPPATAAPAGVLAAPPTRPDADVPKVHGVPDDYRIGEGDVLQISVWKEPDASVPSAVVRPDGKITVPMIKEVQVVGSTPGELEKTIGERLTKYIPGADVTVVVSGIHSKRIYVVGAVKKEGPIPYTYRMTVMQALSEAGGLTDYAKRKKIYVLRTDNGKEFRLPFDYDAVLRGERMELNIPLMANDTLVIPH
jgi:polysaccharide export outer membrane protein